MMIDTFTLLGQPITITVDDPGRWSGDGMGRASSRHAIIHLRDGMPEATTAETLLHEIIHLICDFNALPLRNDETPIAVLSNTLFAVMRDNPTLRAIIFGGSVG